MRRIMIVSGITLGAAVWACGTDTTSTPKDSATADTKITADAKQADAPRGVDAAVDGPAGTFQLTVKNYQNWCSVKVGPGSASTAAVQTAFFANGVVTLVAGPASSTFQLGSDMWHHVDGTTGDTGVPGTQTGSGSAALSTARATIAGANKCVWVCCPFSPGGNGCETQVTGDLCP